MSATAETHEGGGWRGRASSILSSYGGFAPAIVLIGGFFFVPLGIVVAYSFWQDENYTVVHHWTTENYRYFFSVSAYVSTMWATLWVAALGTAISIGLAFPFAYWLSRYVPRRLRAPLLVLVVVPFWTSYLLRVYSWITILGDKGLLNRFLEWTGITSGPVSVFLYNRAAVILVLVYLYFPFAALTLYSSIERFDWNQLRAAMDLGASPLTAIRRILLPADPARHRDRRDLPVHPHARRVPDAADRGWHAGRDDRQPDRRVLPAGPVRARLGRLAAGGGVHRAPAARVPALAADRGHLWPMTPRSCPAAAGSRASR